MPHCKVALLQLTARASDPQANLAKGELACRQAQALGADIALFPEMWNVGYTFPRSPDPTARQAWASQAIDPDSAFFQHYQRLAAELDMAIALTYLEKWPGLPRNTLSLIDRHGQLVLTYAKVHTCDFDYEAALTPGDAFHVCTLDTRGGPLQVGAMICFDREFPESARILMLMGAELILTPNACELEANRLGQFRARAFENMVGLAMANYAAPQQNGHSVAFDGQAFEEEGKCREMCLVQAGESEGVYLADFDLDRLRAYREREVWGNGFRKPQAYGSLSSPAVEPPFLRASSRR